MRSSHGSRVGWIAAGTLTGLILAVAPLRAEEMRAPLRVGSWGGAYLSAMQKVVFDGFTSRTGIPVEVETLTSLDGVRQSASQIAHPMMLADLPATDAEQICAEGLAQPVGPDILSPDASGAAPERDFLLPVGPCGVAATLTAELVIYDKTALGANAPSKVGDLFDLKRFPGKRALKRDAMGTLEWALLADGVAPDAIYPTLSTPGGVERAFAKLESIRGQILWWDHGDVPIKALARKDVVMAAVYGARAYQAIVGDAQPFGLIWPGALVSANRWVLLKGAGESQAAREFIKFATDRERLSQLARSVPYGPARRSSLPDLPPERASYLASSPEHMGEAILLDAGFWQKNAEALRQRFEAWLATAPPPLQKGGAPQTGAGGTGAENKADARPGSSPHSG